MQKPELYRVTTLWFVALIALYTAPPALEGPLQAGNALAVGLLYLLPLYVALSLARRGLAEVLSD